MAGFVLVHGAGDSAHYWHLVAPGLEKAGHQVATPECPPGTGTLAAWTDVVAAAADSLPRPLVIVAQSFGAFPATLAADRISADVLVLLAGMVPRLDESPDDWWVDTAYAGSGAPAGLDERAIFYHDVDPEIADVAARRGIDAELTDLDQPIEVDIRTMPTRVVLGTADRFFPFEWLSGVVRDRLDVERDVLEAGHCMALSRPHELVALLAAYARN